MPPGALPKSPVTVALDPGIVEPELHPNADAPTRAERQEQRQVIQYPIYLSFGKTR